MSDIADNLPLEIIRHIFALIESSVRASQAEITRSIRHDHIEPSGAAETIPDIPTFDYKAFANFRLVSRQWKIVADTFFFREVEIKLDFSFDSHNNESYVFSRVMNPLLKRGYASLIRTLYVCVYLASDEQDSIGQQVRTGNQQEGSVVDRIMGHFRRLLLTAESCFDLHLRFSIEPNFITNFSASTFLKTTLETIREALKRSPNMRSHLSICFHNNPYQFSFHDPILEDDPERQEQWLTSELPRELRSVTESLELASYLPLSDIFFHSFRSVKKLYLEKVGPPYRQIRIEAIERGLCAMPFLEHLDLRRIQISEFPTELRSLKMNNLVLPDTKFLKNLCNLEKLDVLQLSFFDKNTWSWTVEHPHIDWSQITDIRSAGLRTLEIATRYYAPHVTTFCERVLAKASLLENIKVVNVGVKDSHLANTLSHSLESVVLTHHEGEIVYPREPPGQIDKCGYISWSALKTLLSKNSRIRLLQLGIDSPFFNHFMFEDIEEISMLSPQLERFHVFQTEIRMNLREAFIQDPVTAYRWLLSYRPYSAKISHMHENVMRKVLSVPADPHGRTQEFVIDLEVFRRMKKYGFERPR